MTAIDKQHLLQYIKTSIESGACRMVKLCEHKFKYQSYSRKNMNPLQIQASEN